MPILACGINHKTAPIEVRELFAKASQDTKTVLQGLSNTPSLSEAVILSTCNRTEIYTLLENQNNIENWFSDKMSKLALNHETILYSHTGLNAIRHIFRVASGLDSMVLGEPQILGQMKEAFAFAQEAGTVGTQLRRLFPAVFSVSKHIRRETDISKNPVSFAYATVQLAKQIFAQLNSCRILLVGAGEMIELVALHLQGQGVHQFTIANRTIEKSSTLAEQLLGKAIRIGEIPHYLSQTDIVISATSSQLPIIGKGMLETVLKNRKRKPMFMVDLAMPRDIEPEIAALEDIYLYNIDDLQNITAQNLKNRQEAAAQAEAIIDIQARHYIQKLQILNAGDMIRHFRSRMESMRDQEVEKAIQKLRQGLDKDLVLASLARNLTNKFMHQPTIKLREAAYNDDVNLILFAKEILNI